MIHMHRALAIALVAWAATGCARMEFQDDKGADIGIRYYGPKPYLLIPKEGEAKIVYLPDLDKPMYAKPHAGIGMTKLSLSLNEAGTLSSFNLESDPKVADLVGSLANLAKVFREESKKVAPGENVLFEIVMTKGGTTLKKVEPK